MPRRLRHRISTRPTRLRFSKPALLGVGLTVLIIVAAVLLSSDGSLSTGFATLGKSIDSSLASLDGKEHVSLAQSPSGPPIALREPQPAGTRVYIYGKGLVASKSSDGAVLYYHQDALGSNRVVTDASGQIQSKSAAYPYGEPVQVEGFGSKQSRYTFTGKELDSKLYYYGARYYNPRTARFTAVDPASGVGSSYEYAASNPLKFVDPDGRAVEYNAFIHAIFSNPDGLGGMGAVQILYPDNPTMAERALVAAQRIEKMVAVQPEIAKDLSALSYIQISPFDESVRGSSPGGYAPLTKSIEVDYTLSALEHEVGHHVNREADKAAFSLTREVRAEKFAGGMKSALGESVTLSEKLAMKEGALSRFAAKIVVGLNQGGQKGYASRDLRLIGSKIGGFASKWGVRLGIAGVCVGAAACAVQAASGDVNGAANNAANMVTGSEGSGGWAEYALDPRVRKFKNEAQ